MLLFMVSNLDIAIGKKKFLVRSDKFMAPKSDFMKNRKSRT